jgi:hypothetical protein
MTLLHGVVLYVIFEGRNREKEARGWRRLRNEELHNLYASPYIIRVTKSRIRWEGHLARTGEM